MHILALTLTCMIIAQLPAGPVVVKYTLPAGTLATAYILMLDIGILIMHLHTQVEILSGKDRGNQGRVMVVARALNRVYVEGLNTVC